VSVLGKLEWEFRLLLKEFWGGILFRRSIPVGDGITKP